MAYNRRHGRHGHLFQNRYKSIVCDEDTYFRELVRYIHLNPIRAKIVKGMSDLDRYAWSGHSAIMGVRKNKWQNRNYVLSWFGVKEKEAKRAYREFVVSGMQEGRRPELVGGGLIRSLGGWAAVKSMRRKGERAVTDERILGSGEFVERLLQEAEEKTRRQVGRSVREKEVAGRIEERCKEANVNIKELQMGSRRGRISEVRKRLIKELVKGYGLPLAEVARQLGVTTGAVSNCLKRAEKK